jgi:hypothetical protein
MAYRLQNRGLVWLGIGICLGLLFSGVLPHTPLHAYSNDRSDDFAIATGPVDDSTEAIYFLDFLTGDLRAAVVGPVRKFAAFYTTNIRNDLEPTGAAGKTSRYIMITGMASDIRFNRGSARPATAMLYIANCSNGMIGAYNLFWDKTTINRGQQVVGQPILLVDKRQFRTAVIAPGAK